MKVNKLTHDPVQAEGSESAPTFAEVFELDHLLSESHTGKSSEDVSMYLNSESTEKCLTDNLTCTPHYYNQEVDYFRGGHLIIKKESNASEVSDLSAGVNLMIKPNAGQCTSVLDKMGVYELQSAFGSIFGRDTCVTDIRWLKRRISLGMQNLLVDCVDDIGRTGSLSSLGEDNMILKTGNVLCERVHTFYTVARDKRALTAGGGLENDNDSDSCGESQKPTCKAPGDGFKIPNSAEHGSALKYSRRLRKPTRRFIEEISEPKSRCYKERLAPSDFGYKVKILQQGILKRNLAYEDYHAATDTQVHHALPFQKGDPSKGTPFPNYDPKTLDDASEEILNETSEDSLVIRNKKGRTQRKHHKQWVLPEVMKLIDGVSQYGVGRWTDIKRKLFSKLIHRTPVDLKDKWRNLLRAAAQPCNQRKVAQDEIGSIHSIPLPVLWRVRELSVIHPYPRKRKTAHPSLITASIRTSTSPTGMTIQEQGSI